ncbi:MAG: hypothetical protein JO042_13570 [Sinobacteraceae bacterium]|nr:hypothetical protein [Nevskiaceae bacterium]
MGCCALRALQVACAAVLSVALTTPAFAIQCDAIPSGGEPIVYQNSVQVRGEGPVKQTFVTHATSEFMVFARERGVDVTLEVRDSTGNVLGRADNPIRRT